MESQPETPSSNPRPTGSGSGSNLPEHIKRYAEEFQRARSFEDDDLYFPLSKAPTQEGNKPIVASQVQKDTPVNNSGAGWQQQPVPTPASSFQTPQRPTVPFAMTPQHWQHMGPAVQGAGASSFQTPQRPTMPLAMTPQHWQHMGPAVQGAGAFSYQTPQRQTVPFAMTPQHCQHPGPAIQGAGAFSYQTPQPPTMPFAMTPQNWQHMGPAVQGAGRSQSQPASVAKGYTVYNPDHFRQPSMEASAIDHCFRTYLGYQVGSAGLRAMNKHEGPKKKTKPLNGNAPVFRSRAYTTSPLRKPTPGSINHTTMYPTLPSTQPRPGPVRADQPNGPGNL